MATFRPRAPGGGEWLGHGALSSKCMYVATLDRWHDYDHLADTCGYVDDALLNQPLTTPLARSVTIGDLEDQRRTRSHAQACCNCGWQYRFVCGCRFTNDIPCGRGAKHARGKR